ncbi:glycoside hydrolase family 28 protein [Actinoallomurus sp. CA-150999]|uniref:glycoside hydrolase family 28 protein n=1 Tax=Actinoallomurus sp. CA-150999 TaxID=3239887 RepID=UPI003D8C9E28
MDAASSRRQFLRIGGLVAGGALIAGSGWRPSAAATTGQPGGDDPWSVADRIVRTTPRPRIPNRRVDVTKYGAVGDGKTDCTKAFAAAIGDLAGKGGGRVVVPPGRYLTGSIHWESRIDLHVEKGATIAFSTDPAAYLPVVYTRDGGIECMNYSPFIYAYDKHDIAITGEGTLDGQADNQHWWPWAGKTQFGWQPGMPTSSADSDLLASMADQGVPVSKRVFGSGHYLRPQFIQPYRCKNVLISGITLHNTPNWQLNPVLCTNVIVENVTAGSLGPNNDGCDPESCDHVVISGCTFETGDDCIAVKAGKNADGRRVNTPCQNIVIQNCEFLAGHGAITIGSEMTGGVRNLYARDSRVDSLNLNQGLRLKTNSARGGFIEQVHLKNVKIEKLADSAILVDFFYGEGPGHGFNPSVRDIHVENLFVGTAAYPLYAVGYTDDLIKNITVENTIVEHASRASVARYVDGLTFDNVYINGALATPPKPYPDLAAAYNNVAIGTASTPGDIDGGGRYYTADSLAAAGLTPGATVTHGGLGFTWPNVAAGQPDNVAASDEVINLSGSGGRLGFLAVGTHGDQSGTVNITYTDGTSSTGTISATDWWTAQAKVGDELVATATANGGRTVGVYYCAVPLTAGKTAASLELPANSSLHIFAVAIG